MEIPVVPPGEPGYPAGSGQLDIFAARMASAGATAIQVLADDIGQEARRAREVREHACERLEDDVLPAIREVGVTVVVDPGAQRARYVPDERPVREQSGPARDSVVVPAAAVDPAVSTVRLQQHHSAVLAAVSLAAGQRGRLDRPDARRVASELAGRRSCPASAARAEEDVGREFTRQQFKRLWPGGPHPRGASTLDAKRAANAASGWVGRAVKARDERLDAELAAYRAPAAPKPADTRGSLPPIGARPAAPPVSTPGDSRRPER
ncbi:MAG: hypothetical protein OXH69_23580 [Acidobacteria bacterium]|nr:hypothetical protein [Acidobacteriota bacterium]